MSDELNNFLTSQAKLNTIAKEQGKSINLLNIKYKVLNKVLGPFYRLFVDIQNKVETTNDVFEKFTKTNEAVTESTEKVMGPMGKLLKTFRNINTIMIFVLGAFALLGAGIFLLSKHLGGGETALGAFNMVMEAGKGLVDAFIGVISTIAGVIGGLDFSAFGGTFMPVLETAFAILGGILTLYITFITTVLDGIGQIVERMNEAGMFQRIVDAFATFFGLVGMAIGIIIQAIDDTGVTMDDLISGIRGGIQYFVDFLFSSGILDFAVQVIEYIAVIYGAIAVVVASVISLFIKIWAKLGPPIINFVKAFFDFFQVFAVFCSFLLVSFTPFVTLFLHHVDLGFVFLGLRTNAKPQRKNQIMPDPMETTRPITIPLLISPTRSAHVILQPPRSNTEPQVNCHCREWN